MTWSRYDEIHAVWQYEPSLQHLLSVIAIATTHGKYKLPERPKSGKRAAEELMSMFPGGVIKSGTQ
jgi:hypothetical protein